MVDLVEVVGARVQREEPIAALLEDGSLICAHDVVRFGDGLVEWTITRVLTSIIAVVWVGWVVLRSWSVWLGIYII